jgi:type III secretion protein U
MSQEEPSEHKSLPASEKKLRDARRKGQVSNSKDLLSGFGLLVVCLYLMLFWTDIRDHLVQLTASVSQLTTEPFEKASAMAIHHAEQIVMMTTLPIVAILLLTVIVMGGVSTLGPVLSFELIKPNFDHVNPASGLKRIFSMRNVVEFLKGIVKVVILGAALFFVLRGWVQPLFDVPACGFECTGVLVIAILKPIIGIAAFAFVVIGFFDMGMQRWLFLRDMRMTKTEYKRERKDIEGDPLIRGERKRLRQSLALLSSRLGLPMASFVVHGRDTLVGVRFHRVQTPVPMVVCRAKSVSETLRMRGEAKRHKIVVVENAELAHVLSRQAMGEMIGREYFSQIAAILVSHGLV